MLRCLTAASSLLPKGGILQLLKDSGLYYYFLFNVNNSIYV